MENIQKRKKFVLLVQYFLERLQRLKYAHKGLIYCQLPVSFFKQLMEIVKERCSSNAHESHINSSICNIQLVMLCICLSLNILTVTNPLKALKFVIIKYWSYFCNNFSLLTKTIVIFYLVYFYVSKTHFCRKNLYINPKVFFKRYKKFV